MNIARSLTALAAALTLVAGTAAGAGAMTATVTFPVTANVVSDCTISATALAFGNYDPLVANASAALNATNTITLACVKGVTPVVGLDSGLNTTHASGTTRAMASGANYLSYELYKDAAHTQVWGNSGTGLFTAATTTGTAPFGVTVYGQIPPAQTSSPTGSYSDTITATVNF